MASSPVRRGVLLATLPCFVVFLSGCGGGGSPAATPSPTPAPTAAPTPPTPQPTAAPTMVPTPPPPAWTKSVCEKVDKQDAGVTMHLEEAGCNDTTKQVVRASVSVSYQNAIPLVPPQKCDDAIKGYLGSVCKDGTVEQQNETYAKCLIKRMNGSKLLSTEVDIGFCDGKSTFFTSNTTVPSSYPYPTAQSCDFAINAFKDGMRQGNFSCPGSLAPTAAPTPQPTAAPTTPHATPAPTTPHPTAAPTTPHPTAAPTQLPLGGHCPATYPHDDAPWCTTKECCKAGAKYPEDEQICDDFYDTNTSVAFTMITVDVWNGGAKGSAGMDTAGFNEAAPSTVNQSIQQAMSISNFRKAANPYPGANSSHGLAFGIGRTSGFWKYFETCPDDGKLCAQCSDGFHCGAAQRQILPTKTDYATFREQVNQIVAQTGTAACKIQSQSIEYNEFDTNGLSANDLAGVFVAKPTCGASQEPAPSYSSVCKFMSRANPKRTKPFPVFAYAPRGDATPTSSSLTLQCYLDCSSDAAPEFETDTSILV